MLRQSLVERVESRPAAPGALEAPQLHLPAFADPAILA